MARRSKRKVNAQVKQRRMYAHVINSIVRSEPVIRVRDRRRDYGIRRGNYEKAISEGFRRLPQRVPGIAPGRRARVSRNRELQKANPTLYARIHDCQKEWRTTLAWRASQGAGRKRTQRELKQNKSSFMKKDC